MLYRHILHCIYNLDKPDIKKHVMVDMGVSFIKHTSVFCVFIYFFVVEDLRPHPQAFNCPVYSSHAYAVHVHITYNNDIVFVKQVSRDENFTDIFWSSQNCSESNVTKILTGKIVFIRTNSSTPDNSILVSNYGTIVVIIHMCIF